MGVTLSAFEISLDVVLGGLLIAVARVFDVSLGVLRHSAQARGRRKAAWGFGFIESLVWLVVVASIIGELDNPIYAIFYALGFATGTFVGLTLEGFLAKGEQVVRIFTHQGDKMAEVFREKGWRVTQFEGKGRDGNIQLLFIHLTRKKAREIPALARSIDDSCFIVVDDVRSSSAGFRSVTAQGQRK